MSRCRWLPLFLLLPGIAGWVLAGPDDSPIATLLDLPSGGRGIDTEKEDLPETIIFYDQTYEGDGFYWCLDKSGSMVDNDRIKILKSEVSRAVRNLSPSANFGIVAFSSNIVRFSHSPLPATHGNKTQAIAWVETLEAEGSTCAGAAGVATLQISNRCPKSQKVIIFLSDGRPACGSADTADQALTEITTANYQGTPINTLLLGNVPGGLEFMRALAMNNQGSFAHLDSN